jgi:hypothetical protein
MNTKIAFLVLGAGALFTVGCGNARTPDQYAADTQAVLAAKNGAIKDCYEAELRKDKAARGQVTVAFNVEPDTGKIDGVHVVTPATPGLTACVTAALDGLALQPGDSNQGVATFTWDFTPGPTPPAPPPMAAPGAPASSLPGAPVPANLPAPHH